MKYTIAIPAYNNETTIEKAIESCLNQKGEFDYEVLLSDDGSKDFSNNVYDKFLANPKFNLIKHENNSSLYENHNRCLRASKGEYVLFCHADDTLFEDALLKIDLSLSSYNYPTKMVCFGRSFFRDFYRSYCHLGQLNKIVSGISVQELFQHGGLTPSGTCYSKKSFLESGGFLPMQSRITPSDISSMIKFSLNGAEFLMLDRIIFNREYASTACNITEEENYDARVEAINELFKVVGLTKMETLFGNIDHYSNINLKHMICMSKYSNNKALKARLKLKYIISNPLSLKNIFTLKLLFK